MERDFHSADYDISLCGKQSANKFFYFSFVNKKSSKLFQEIFFL
jgi:hypothetical protein